MEKILKIKELEVNKKTAGDKIIVDDDSYALIAAIQELKLSIDRLSSAMRR